MLVTRSCEACGRSFEARSRAHRFCDRPPCTRRRERFRKRGRKVVPFRPRAEEGPVCVATRAELEAAGRLHSSAGQVALALARRLDHPEEDTGSSQAAVSKQLHALMTEALQGAGAIPGDPVDELRARRERRLREAMT